MDMKGKKVETITYFNDTQVDQLRYDGMQNVIVIHPGETRTYISKIIPEDRGFMTIAIPKRLR